MSTCCDCAFWRTDDFISNAGWNWRQFFALALAGTVVIFVLLTGGLIKIG